MINIRHFQLYYIFQIEYCIVWNQLGCLNVDLCLNAICKEEGEGGEGIEVKHSVLYGS